MSYLEIGSNVSTSTPVCPGLSESLSACKPCSLVDLVPVLLVVPWRVGHVSSKSHVRCSRDPPRLREVQAEEAVAIQGSP